MKTVYSNSQEQMVIKGFTRTGNGFSLHYTWNDADGVYYNDDCEDDYYMEVPSPRSSGRISVVLD